MTSTFDTTLANLGIGRTGASNPSVQPAGSGSQTLGQADFLKLMTAQMQNQDPFNPVDNTQMVAQMAQFSSLSGISQMNTTLQSIADKLTGTSANDALAYVGKTVLTQGDTAFGRTTGVIAGAVAFRRGDVAVLVIIVLDRSVLRLFRLVVLWFRRLVLSAGSAHVMPFFAGSIGVCAACRFGVSA